MALLFGCTESEVGNVANSSNSTNVTNISINTTPKSIAPDISILSPANSSTVYATFPLQLNVSGFKLVPLGCISAKNEGQVHVYIDNSKLPMAMGNSHMNLTINEIGKHTIKLELKDCKYQSVDPEVVKFLTVEVIPYPLPNSSFYIVSPTDGEKITGGNVTIVLSTKNLSFDNYSFRYSLDSSKPNISSNANFTLSNLNYGNHTLEIDVVNSTTNVYLTSKKVTFELMEPPLPPQPYTREITLRLNNGGFLRDTVYTRYGEVLKLHLFVLEDGSYINGFRVKSSYFDTLIPKGGSSSITLTPNADFTITTYWNGTIDIRDQLKVYVVN